MNSLVKARKKTQQSAAKRKGLGPQIIESPRTQLLKNQQRARAAAEAEKKRVEQMRIKQRAKQEEADKRDMQLRDAQQQAVADVDMTNGKESAPRERARPRASIPVAAPRASQAIGLPGPECLTAPTWNSVSAMAAKSSPSSIEDLKLVVRNSIDMAVLCAPHPDGQIHTWNELTSPPTDSPFAADWTTWLSPGKWKGVSEAWRCGNTQHLEVVTEAGNYNDVLEVSAATPVTNSSVWPPQLCGSGVTDETLCVFALPRADYVIRMTRTDAFPTQGTETCETFRAMKLESVVSEMSLALQAAAQGIGPPIYAAVACPWDRDEHRQNEDTREKRYGMIIIMRKADGNMADWSFQLRRMQQQQAKLPNGPSPALRCTVEEAANFLVNLCFHIGATQHINYDMKQGNLLMHEIRGQFYMTDFDVMYYRYIPPDIAGVKACFFVNLLLLAMHVRAYSDSSTVTNSLLGVSSPILVEIWSEAVNSPATFGPGLMWLKLAKIAPTEELGRFHHRVLAKLPPGQRLGRQLSMMVFEYLFDESKPQGPPPSVKRWSHWAKEQTFLNGHKPLIPQLMRFVVLYDRPVPETTRSLFEAVDGLQPRVTAR